MQRIPIKQANFYQAVNINGKQEFVVMKNDNRARGSRSYDLELASNLLFIRHKDEEVTIVPVANIKEMRVDSEALQSSWQNEPPVQSEESQSQEKVKRKRRTRAEMLQSLQKSS